MHVAIAIVGFRNIREIVHCLGASNTPATPISKSSFVRTAGGGLRFLAGRNPLQTGGSPIRARRAGAGESRLCRRRKRLSQGNPGRRCLVGAQPGHRALSRRYVGAAQAVEIAKRLAARLAARWKSSIARRPVATLVGSRGLHRKRRFVEPALRFSYRRTYAKVTSAAHP